MVIKSINYAKYYTLLLTSFSRIIIKSKIKGLLQSKKSIIIRLENPEKYDRYIYILIKFFHLSGYKIYFPDFNFQVYKRKFFGKNNSKNIYFNLFLKEGILLMGNHPKPKNVCLELNDLNLSSEYFSGVVNKKKVHKDSFFIPIGMHPLNYYRAIWDVQPVFNQIKHSIFISGNMDQEAYKKFAGGLFEMENRPQTYSFLKNSKYYIDFNNIQDVDSFIESKDDKKLIILDRAKTIIEIENFRSYLSKFYFFMALPGVVMPLSHNITEALSVGCIPLIHNNYAELMSPKLIHLENAIIYTGLLHDLDEKIELIFNLTQQEIYLLRSNAFTYYQNNLTPKAVTDKIVSGKYSKFFLLTETHSVPDYLLNQTTQGIR